MKFKANINPLPPEPVFEILPAASRPLSVEKDARIKGFIPKLILLATEKGKMVTESEILLAGYEGFTIRIIRHVFNGLVKTEINVWYHPQRTAPNTLAQRQSVADILFEGESYRGQKWEKEWVDPNDPNDKKFFTDLPGWQDALEKLLNAEFGEDKGYVEAPVSSTDAEAERIRRGLEWKNNLLKNHQISSEGKNGPQLVRSKSA